MESQLFLQNYRVSFDSGGLPLELRRTATGVTYQGENSRSGQEVAIEFVAASSLKPRVREQLMAEGASAKLISQVNIPTLFDYGFEGDRLIYVSEYFEGTIAESWVMANGPMPAAAVLRTALQVLSALRAAEFYGITHHAINPSKLMIVPGKAADGGWPLVKLLDLLGLTPPSSKPGAPEATEEAACYASPEQLQNRPFDFRSEVYSLGCTLWFLLTGKPPFATTLDAAADRPMTMVLELEKFGLPANARRLLLKMLSVDPDERPGDPLTLHEQIQDCLKTLPPSKPPPARQLAPPPRPVSLTGSLPTGRRRFPVKTLAFTSVLLAGAAVAAVMMPERFHSLRLSSKVAEVASFFGWAGRSSEPDVAQAASKPTPSGLPAATPGAAITDTPAEERPQLVSTAGRDASVASANSEVTAPATPTETPSAPTAAADEPVAIADVTPSPAAEDAETGDPSTDLAVNDSPAAAENIEAAPPAEGPIDSLDNPDIVPESQADVSAFPTPAATPFATAEEQSPEPTSTPKQSVKTSKTAKAKSSAKKRSTRRKPRTSSSSKRPAETPSPTPGTVRAQFAGKTPEGKWLLELPPDPNQPKNQGGQPRQVVVDPKP
ncbi:MAG: protein kinase [Chthoniobacterales bacterium]|nr:protein kinase [Chthoniobacterales bacterium]